jgi:hypothetical protein
MNLEPAGAIGASPLYDSHTFISQIPFYVVAASAGIHRLKK